MQKVFQILPSHEVENLQKESKEASSPYFSRDKKRARQSSTSTPVSEQSLSTMETVMDFVEQEFSDERTQFARPRGPKYKVLPTHDSLQLCTFRQVKYRSHSECTGVQIAKKGTTTKCTLMSILNLEGLLAQFLLLSRLAVLSSGGLINGIRNN